MIADSLAAEAPVRLGVRANWRQFLLLAAVTAFVGAMVGLEQTVVPLLGKRVFHIASFTLLLSFIVTFGVTKAFTNMIGTRLSERLGRLRLLILGWTIGLLVPLILLWAPSWGWVVLANVLLGLNQGLCWSMALVMMVDIVGPRRRGLATGTNEFAGYIAVAAVAYTTALLAAHYGLRQAPFELGIGLAAMGLLLTLLCVRETNHYAKHEASALALPEDVSDVPYSRIFATASLRNPGISACCQAGLVNNLNYGMMWGLLPLVGAAAGLPLEKIGILTAAYPLVWGTVQISTGIISDAIGRKRLIAAGLVVQAVALGAFAAGHGFYPWLAAAVALGLGKALVYPTLLAAVADASRPEWRASALGVYRFWRDSGYAVGALLSGGIADLAGPAAAIAVVALLTFLSAVVVMIRMPARQR